MEGLGIFIGFLFISIIVGIIVYNITTSSNNQYNTKEINKIQDDNINLINKQSENINKVDCSKNLYNEIQNDNSKLNNNENTEKVCSLNKPINQKQDKNIKFNEDKFNKIDKINNVNNSINTQLTNGNNFNNKQTNTEEVNWFTSFVNIEPPKNNNKQTKDIQTNLNNGNKNKNALKVEGNYKVSQEKKSSVYEMTLVIKESKKAPLKTKNCNYSKPEKSGGMHLVSIAPRPGIEKRTNKKCIHGHNGMCYCVKSHRYNLKCLPSNCDYYSECVKKDYSKY